MAKTSDYKITKVMVGDYKTNDLTESSENLIDTICKIRKKKLNKHIYGVFQLKRRQSLSTWENQVIRYLFSNAVRFGITTNDFDEFCKILNLDIEFYTYEVTGETYMKII